MNKAVTEAKTLVRFQCFLTRDQHAYIKRLAAEKGISGGYAVRKGLNMFAKRRGEAIK